MLLWTYRYLIRIYDTIYIYYVQVKGTWRFEEFSLKNNISSLAQKGDQRTERMGLEEISMWWGDRFSGGGSSRGKGRQWATSELKYKIPFYSQNIKIGRCTWNSIFLEIIFNLVTNTKDNYITVFIFHQKWIHLFTYWNVRWKKIQFARFRLVIRKMIAEPVLLDCSN